MSSHRCSAGSIVRFLACPDELPYLNLKGRTHLSPSVLCRQYRIPIKAALNSTTGAHSLKIVIQPAPQAAIDRAAKYRYNVPGLTQPGGMSYYNYIRKPASDFGWDWGPAFAPAGLYGTVELQAYSTAILTGAVDSNIAFF